MFGPEWTSLALEDIARFLRTVDEGEGLLWEAKGTQVHPGEIRKQVCGFANSHDGGYLILGARWAKADLEWSLDGVSFDGEPTLWISDVIQSGVRPLPRFDVVGWPVDDERHVAVVRADPTPTPPCNANGTVYERVAGATVSVRDPQRLAELFGRGDQARTSAELLATNAALRLLDRGRQVDGYRDMRHTFATWSLAAGMSIFTLARRMGTSVPVIDATYGHLAIDADGNDRELLDAYDEARGHVVGTNSGEDEEMNFPENNETAPERGF
jgi:hypothetical protein